MAEKDQFFFKYKNISFANGLFYSHKNYRNLYEASSAASALYASGNATLFMTVCIIK